MPAMRSGLVALVLLVLVACSGSGKPKPIESDGIDSLHAYLVGVGNYNITDARLQQAVATGKDVCSAKTKDLHSYAADLKQSFNADEALVIHFLCPWRTADYS